MKNELRQKSIVVRRRIGRICTAFTLLFTLLFNSGSLYSQDFSLYSNLSWVSESATQNAVVKSYSVVDAHGYLYVAGASINSSGNYDAYVSKLSPTGNLEWDFVKSGLDSSDDFASFIYVDPN